MNFSNLNFLNIFWKLGSKNLTVLANEVSINSQLLGFKCDFIIFWILKYKFWNWNFKSEILKLNFWMWNFGIKIFKYKYRPVKIFSKWNREFHYLKFFENFFGYFLKFCNPNWKIKILKLKFWNWHFWYYGNFEILYLHSIFQEFRKQKISKIQIFKISSLHK